MRVLIVESNAALAGIWRAHLERLGAEVCLVTTQAEAIAVLQKRVIDVIVLNLMLAQGSALAVADYASYRQPGARVVFVTNTSFFSDGSIFRHVGNACAFLPSGISPEDLAAVVDHYAMR
ncbi:Response regulator receiver domain-containing protein [Meinhardsimonia xiamenensis]|jgi:CheY-like chemotaxis protein|uniref:Response regulator receiver domain-containing protein n=1 Tax=Meinhardsimonia xiamenensis TaxID=990712 RepID=A0A1G8XS66_9RHOB|nr:response regulator [Meinhardsimonia xiamenensis]PRX37011.1 response regulator receiver domain-containing protein [Meinhardsimonia xiamenensis]SDJ93014.1 Response regulator receiver domain-containing protein [Meinhardsimonia xiamenensis]